MSLLNSISTAITGLYAQTACMSNVSDNLANASTTGYKTIGTNFSDLVSTDRVPDVGSGVRATPAYYNNLQGAISTVNLNTYLAISGRGFFPVTLADSTGGGPVNNETFYTRSGDFCLNNGGYLANSEGYCLMGWNTNSTTGVVDQNTLVPIQISDLIENAVPTTRLGYDANIPATEAVGYTSPGTSVTIYDSAGNSHEVTYTWQKISTNVWDLTVSAPGGGSPDFTGTARFNFTTGGVIDSITSSNFSVSGTNLGFTLNYSGAAALPLTATFGGVTQFADSSLIVSSFTQNGVAAGTFTSLSIDENGFVSLNYSNGVSRTYYQIPLSLFNAPEQLQRKSGTAFRTTESSGSASYAAAGTFGAGKLVASAIENSTVDIADQFTTMIKAQQAYSANAKMISTADSMLETLVSV